MKGELAVKRAVRERDSFRCTKCGISNDECRSRFGKQLEVHRLEPGSPYSVDGCVSLCRPCHGFQPKSSGNVLADG